MNSVVRPANTVMILLLSELKMPKSAAGRSRKYGAKILREGTIQYISSEYIYVEEDFHQKCGSIYRLGHRYYNLEMTKATLRELGKVEKFIEEWEAMVIKMDQE